MIRSYFKIAWRNITRNRVSSFINIAGLAVGMAVTLLIALWIRDEVTFNNYHTHHRQLAQVMSTSFNDQGESGTGSAVALPLGEELAVKFAGDFQQVSMASWSYDHTLLFNEKLITGKGMWVEAGFPQMFSLKMLKGNIQALGDPSSILLSAEISKTLFGDTDPLNKIVRVANKTDLRVAGIYEDLPENTTLHEVQILLPWKRYIVSENWLKEAQTQWNNHSFQAFVQINDAGSMDKVSEKIRHIAMTHKNASTEGREELSLHAMDKWHLYSNFQNGKATGGRIRYVWMFGIIGFFILLLACINFMNLSTARSEKRAKEVGIRKTVGSLRTQLIGQFLSEAVLMSLISFCFALLLTLLIMPVFNNLADKTIHIPWQNPLFWSCAVLAIVITGLMAGSYPSFFLSRFEPIRVLKGTFRAGRAASLPRKILVVIQFTFSIALIIGTIIVYQQIQHGKHRPVNYRHEGLITIPMSTPDLYGHYDAVRNELLGTGVVANMAESSSATTTVSSNNIGFNWKGKSPNTLPGFGTIYVTGDFGSTIGWQVKEGRDFSREYSTDSLSIVINEAAVKQIGIEKNIVGETIQYRDKNYTVIGVIKDMIMESPYTPVRPTIFFNDLNYCNTVTISIRQGAQIEQALHSIKTVFEKYHAPFDYKFNDDVYAKKFSEEQRVGDLATFFTALAIFISCIGIFGLASFVAEQRTKEIGVRKILGASVLNLWSLLSKDFVMLILISCAIAIPVSYYFLHTWLQEYSYRVTISAGVFLAAIAGSILITLFTISFQTIKAAIANPVKSLRNE